MMIREKCWSQLQTLPMNHELSTMN